MKLTLEALGFSMLLSDLNLDLFGHFRYLLYFPHLPLHLIHHLRANLICFACLFRQFLVLFVLASKIVSLERCLEHVF